MNKNIFKVVLHISLTSTILCSLGLSTAYAATTTASTTVGTMQLQRHLQAEQSQIEKLNNKLYPKPGINRSLRRKSSGKDVELLQQFLKIYGAYSKELITGYFGPLTEAAVKRFQEKESIDAVGIVGPKTRGRIFALSREKLRTNQETSAMADIINAVLTASIAENGSVAAPLTRFASTTENIYAVLSLKNSKRDSQIGYIRYRNGNFVDSQISHPSRDGLAYFHFQWSLKPGKNRSIGDYSLVFYVNGKKSKIIDYAVY